LDIQKRKMEVKMEGERVFRVADGGLMGMI